MKIVKIEDKDYIELERIIIDGEKEEALKFLKMIQEKMKAEEQCKCSPDCPDPD